MTELCCEYLSVRCVCYCVTYEFQSESTFYSCLNVKELLAWSRHNISSLSDSNGIWTHNHLVRKQVRKWTLNHLVKLAKWLSCVVSTYQYGVIPLLSLKLQLWCLLWAKSSLTFRQTIECRFTLKFVCDMITYSQIHRADKYSKHSSINWPVWLNGWVFVYEPVYELIGCGFESRCCYLNLRYGACFEQEVPWHSDKL